MERIETIPYPALQNTELTIEQVLLDGKPGLRAILSTTGKTETHYLLLPSPKPPSNIDAFADFHHQANSIQENNDPSTWLDFFAWNDALKAALKAYTKGDV